MWRTLIGCFFLIPPTSSFAAPCWEEILSSGPGWNSLLESAVDLIGDQEPRPIDSSYLRSLAQDNLSPNQRVLLRTVILNDIAFGQPDERLARFFVTHQAVLKDTTLSQKNGEQVYLDFAFSELSRQLWALATLKLLDQTPSIVLNQPEMILALTLLQFLQLDTVGGPIPRFLKRVKDPMLSSLTLKIESTSRFLAARIDEARPRAFDRDRIEHWRGWMTAPRNKDLWSQSLQTALMAGADVDEVRKFAHWLGIEPR